jgi:hypothetical protein
MPLKLPSTHSLGIGLMLINRVEVENGQTWGWDGKQKLEELYLV